MKTSKILSSLLLGSFAIFSGCSSNNTNSNTAITYSYSVQVQNITAGQPMSPLLVSSSALFTVGESATDGLEQLAEGGDNSALLNTDSVSGNGLIVPSASDTVTIDSQAQAVSIATMLVKTNDGFAGVNAYDVSSLAQGDSIALYLNVYDAGTETNSETNATVPGLGGEGYNATRETSNIVTLHNGIISKDDGLVTSGLTSVEKFNNPVAKVTITRTK